MNKITRTFYCNFSFLLLAILLVGCTGESNSTSTTDKFKDNPNAQSGEKSDDTEEKIQDDEKESTSETEENSQVEKKDYKSNSATESIENIVNKKENESKPTDTNKNAPRNSNKTSSNEGENADSNNGDKSKVDTPLAKYSSKEIEYARIWLQLGPNQDIDELYIRYIPAGTPLNPDDETSANYPENVTQLSGSRLVDGSVTYSSNGDGTINVYTAIPLRWDGIYPAGQKEYTNILKNKKRVDVDVGNDEKIIKIINKMKK